MNTAQVIPFRFETREVRTLLIDDQIWFVASDVCRILAFGNSRQALSSHVDNEEKGVQVMDTPGGEQKLTVVNESGLYSLIFGSRKPEAKRFKKWVTAEVLPAIRKYGRYEDTLDKMSSLIGKTIGTDGFHMLGALVAGKVRTLPVNMQRSAKMKIWCQLHTAFGVKSAEDIPARELDGARQFIASYAIEGEYLPAQNDPVSIPVNVPATGRHWRYEYLDMHNCGWTTQLNGFLGMLEQHKGRTVSLDIQDAAGLKKELISLQHLVESYRMSLTRINTDTANNLLGERACLNRLSH